MKLSAVTAPNDAPIISTGGGRAMPSIPVGYSSPRVAVVALPPPVISRPMVPAIAPIDSRVVISTPVGNHPILPRVLDKSLPEMAMGSPSDNPNHPTSPVAGNFGPQIGAPTVQIEKTVSQVVKSPVVKWGLALVVGVWLFKKVF
jgi:hypothetical protein